MPLAKRYPRYAVQDVFVIIQNGKSNEDTEIDDTDANEEESDNDACMVEENQEASDCPASVLNEPQSNKHTTLA